MVDQDKRQRLIELAREVIKNSVDSVAKTKRSEGNRVETAILNKALLSLDAFHEECDPLTFLQLVTGDHRC